MTTTLANGATVFTPIQSRTFDRVVSTAGRLTIEIEPLDGEWVAVETLTGMFGEGATSAEAYDDLVQSLAALREAMRADADHLDEHHRGQLRAVDSFFGR